MPRYRFHFLLYISRILLDTMIQLVPQELRCEQKRRAHNLIMGEDLYTIGSQVPDCDLDFQSRYLTKLWKVIFEFLGHP